MLSSVFPCPPRFKFAATGTRPLLRVRQGQRMAPARHLTAGRQNLSSNSTKNAGRQQTNARVEKTLKYGEIRLQVKQCGDFLAPSNP